MGFNVCSERSHHRFSPQLEAADVRAWCHQASQLKSGMGTYEDTALLNLDESLPVEAALPLSNEKLNTRLPEEPAMASPEGLAL